MEQELTVIEVRDLMRSNQNLQLIDLRPSEEFQKDAIEGFINIPLNNLSMKITELDGGKLTILLCDDGSLSHQGLLLLEACGFKVQIVRGGITDWKKIIQVLNS
ncbi:MAG: rhodanese-like domain-containing protein [Deltaproteobacteria bacterium]|nr:rhodanese-like domain-containing protein [Deltaproteobacteria bacterium]